jgi:type I restriction enzyme S subunit
MSDFVSLGDHITIQKGKAPLAIGYSGPQATAYLNPEYLRGRASAELAKPGSDAVYTRDGDTILLWDGSNAGEFFRAKSGLVASTMAKITPDTCFNSAYFFHVSKHAETYLKNQTNGTGIPHVDRELLEAIRVYCPEPAEQLRLAEILDHLDMAIQEAEAIIAKLRAVKKGLLQDLLTRGINANGELRPSQAEAPYLYKPSPLGLIPKEWTFGTLLTWLAGKPRNGYSPQEAGEWTGIQMLGLGCLTNEGFEPVQLKPAPLGDRRLATAKLADGDLLISRSNTRDLVGLAGVYRNVGTPCTYPDLMMRLQTSTETSGEFLQFVLRSSGMRRQIQAHAVGTSGSMVKISGKIVCELLTAMPPRPEQGRILNVLSATDSRLRAVKNPGPNGAPWLDDGRLSEAVAAITRLGTHKLMEANEKATSLLIKGLTVEGLPGWDGGRGQTIRYIDWDTPANNRFTVVNQYRVDCPPGFNSGKAFIVPDLVLLVNGIPLVVVECKSPSACPSRWPRRWTNCGATATSARPRRGGRQRGQRAAVPTNQLLVATSFDEARVGSVGAAFEHYAQWKTVVGPDGTGQPRSRWRSARQGGPVRAGAADCRPADARAPAGRGAELHAVHAGRGQTIKTVCRYQQYRAVNRAIARLKTGRPACSMASTTSAAASSGTPRARARASPWCSWCARCAPTQPAALQGDRRHRPQRSAAPALRDRHADRRGGGCGRPRPA